MEYNIMLSLSRFTKAPGIGTPRVKSTSVVNQLLWPHCIEKCMLFNINNVNLRTDIASQEINSRLFKVHI